MLLSKNKTSILTVSILSSLLITFAHLPANGAGTINLTTGAVQTSGNPATILSTTGILFTASTTNASCNDGDESLSNLFDGNRNSKFCSNSGSLSAIPNEVVLDFTDKVVNVTDVGLSTANDAPYRDPKSWDLLGSMDGLTWQLIKANTYDQTVLNSLSRNSDYPDVSVSNAAVFRFLKFIVNDVADLAATSEGDSGGPVVQYSELRFYGTTQNFPTTVTSISPTSGTTAGGTFVTITGTNLANASSVTFGGTAGVITSNNSSQIVVTTPAKSVGLVAVVVTTPGGSATSGTNFTYVSPTTSSSNRQSTNGSCSSASFSATSKSAGRGHSQNANAFCSSTSGPSR